MVNEWMLMTSESTRIRQTMVSDEGHWCIYGLSQSVIPFYADKAVFLAFLPDGVAICLAVSSGDKCESHEDHVESDAIPTAAARR